MGCMSTCCSVCCSVCGSVFQRVAVLLRVQSRLDHLRVRKNSMRECVLQCVAVSQCAAVS